jgi:hypothetical protein
MIRRLALTAGFALLGAMALAPKAHAQAAPASETVPFEATLGSTCTLSNPLQGDLVEAGDLLTSDPLEGGARGKIDVECTGNNTVSVAAPVEVSVPAGLSTIAGSEQARLFDAGVEIADSDTGTTGSVAPGNVTLEVEMQVIQDGAGFPPGLYQYDVEVTATPN